MAFELRLPSRGLLARVPGPAQTGLRRTERQLAPRFVALGDVSRLRVLLIDDVVTTGATLAEGSRVLLEAGAAAVVGLALAKTPARLPVTASGRSVGVAHVTTG